MKLVINLIDKENGIGEENLTSSSISVRFGTAQTHFSNLQSYIAVVDKENNVIEILERGCTPKEQENFFIRNKDGLFYVGKANKYGSLTDISFIDYVADSIRYSELNPREYVCATFFKIKKISDED